MSESLPSHELPAPVRSSFHWVVLGLLVVAHAELGALWSPAGILEAPDDLVYVPLALGFLFSQPLLFAFWTAFAPQRLYQRILWGLLLCALVSFAVEGGALFQQYFGAANRSFGWGLGFFMSIDLVLFSVATPILLLVRRLSRWQLAQSAAESTPCNYQANQFGIKHLFILITITAIVCGAFRSLTVIDSSVSPTPVVEVAQIVFQIASVFLPIALIPSITLGSLRRVPATLFYLVTLLAICDAACYCMFVKSQPDDLLQVMLCVQLGGGLSVLFSTLVIRWCGFRLIRGSKA
jgi:hypothetical protein